MNSVRSERVLTTKLRDLVNATVGFEPPTEGGQHQMPASGADPRHRLPSRGISILRIITPGSLRIGLVVIAICVVVFGVYFLFIDAPWTMTASDPKRTNVGDTLGKFTR